MRLSVHVLCKTWEMVISRRRFAENLKEMHGIKKKREGRAKLLFFSIKYANFVASSLQDDNKNRICASLLGVYLLFAETYISLQSEAKVSFTKTRELWEISKTFQTLYLATSMNNVYRALWRGRSCWAIFGSNEDSHVVKWWWKRRPSKKKNTFLVRISIIKKAGGFFISYYMLSLHIITFPQGYVGPCVPCLAWDRIRT